MPRALEPLADRVENLRKARGLTQDNLAFEARKYGASPSLTGSDLSKSLRGLRPYSATLLAAIAGALELDPAEFPEVRLARAREQLDERIVGMEAALRNLATAPALSRSDDRAELEAVLEARASQSAPNAAGSEPAAPGLQDVSKRSRVRRGKPKR